MKRLPMQVYPAFRKYMRKCAAENDISMFEYTKQFIQKKKERKNGFIKI